MIVYKFGGASVKNAEGVRNLASIVKPVKDNLMVVVSAMGKTTNAMERLAHAWFAGDTDKFIHIYNEVKSSHQKVMDDLFGVSSVYQEGIVYWFNKLREKLDESPSLNYDFEYDQIVPFGEMLSTYIVNSYLHYIGVDSNWLDVRTVLKTNGQHREAETDWTLSEQLIMDYISFTNTKVYVTQGFVGGTIDGLSTTLGREGSDYTAAVFGYLFDAERVTIWKDVPGILNADPRWYPDTQKIDEISYHEAIELAFYGAQVIHPKTIKPLENKKIPLFVKSFYDPSSAGTKIYNLQGHVELPPVYILKNEQLLLTISPKHFSFIVDDSLSEIIKVFSKNRVKINLMHNSAINFSVCINSMDALAVLLNELSEKYNVKYNDDLELVSIRHYTNQAVDNMLKGKQVIDSQVSRHTARYVVRKSEWKF